MWEWIWFGGSLVTYLIGANAIKASKVNKIKLFMLVVNAVGILPIIFGKIKESVKAVFVQLKNNLPINNF